MPCYLSLHKDQMDGGQAATQPGGEGISEESHSVGENRLGISIDEGPKKLMAMSLQYWLPACW